MSVQQNEILAKAKEFFSQNKLAESENLINAYIKTKGDDIDAFFLLGNVLHKKGMIGKAIKSFSKVLELDENHTDAAISLSVIYNDIGKYDEARKIFEKTNERVKTKSSGVIEDTHINKKFSDKHFELGELYFSYGRYDEALFEYTKASNLDLENLESRLKIAKVYAKKGLQAKAFDELRKLKNEAPNYLPVRLALGVLYYGNGNVIEAQNEWENVLSKNPQNKEAAMYLNLSKTATETVLSPQQKH